MKGLKDRWIDLCYAWHRYIGGWRRYHFCFAVTRHVFGLSFQWQKGRAPFTDLVTGESVLAPILDLKIGLPFAILHLALVNEFALDCEPVKKPTDENFVLSSEEPAPPEASIPAGTPPDLLPLFALKSVQEYIHRQMREKGWYDSSRTFGDIIALAHSELSEALEDYRNGKQLSEVYYEHKGQGQVSKPCGVPTELADVVIRLLDAAEAYGIDLGRAIEMKVHYNGTRPHRHGGKAL